MAGGLPLLANKLNLLQLITNACNELGITAPTMVIGNSDPQITQLLALATREAKEFFSAGKDREGWSALRKEYTFPIVASSATLTGSFTSGSAVVTNITDTSGLTIGTASITAGMVCVNFGPVPVGTTVLSVNSSTQITLSAVVPSTVASTTGDSFYCGQESYALPSDLDRFMTQTFWDRNFRWQLLGPLNAQEWQVLKSGISPTGPRRRFRIMGNLFYVDPTPADNGSIIAYEYYSNAWCQSTGGTNGTPQTVWTTDTDNYCLDDESLTLGVIWRYLRAKRLSYDMEYKTYTDQKERYTGRDGASRNLPLNASASGIRLLNSTNVPDTGFGS